MQIRFFMILLMLGGSGSVGYFHSHPSDQPRGMCITNEMHMGNSQCDRNVKVTFFLFLQITNYQLLRYNLMFLFVLLVVDFNQFVCLKLIWIPPLKYRDDILDPLVVWYDCSVIPMLSDLLQVHALSGKF